MRCNLLAAAALVLLAGCAQAPLEMGQPSTFGEATKQTLAAQVIDPVPTYDTAVPESSGNTTAKAIERYRTDKVKRPDKVRTSSSTTGSSPTQ